MVLQHERTSASPGVGGILKLQFLGPTPKVSDAVHLRSSLRMCISNKLPADADAVGLGSSQVFFKAMGSQGTFILHWTLRSGFHKGDVTLLAPLFLCPPLTPTQGIGQIAGGVFVLPML